MSIEETKRLDDALIGSWNNQDVDGFIALCADDVVWNDVGVPDPFKGKDAVRAYMEG